MNASPAGSLSEHVSVNMPRDLTLSSAMKDSAPRSSPQRREFAQQVEVLDVAPYAKLAGPPRFVIISVESRVFTLDFVVGHANRTLICHLRCAKSSPSPHVPLAAGARRLPPGIQGRQHIHPAAASLTLSCRLTPGATASGMANTQTPVRATSGIACMCRHVPHHCTGKQTYKQCNTHTCTHHATQRFEVNIYGSHILIIG